MEKSTMATYKTIQNLFKSEKLAVLSTQSIDGPYSSLMAFTATDDLQNIFFVTPLNSRKYLNMIKIPNVACLISNSRNEESDFQDSISVTATGIVKEVPSSKREEIVKGFILKHPSLESFAKSEKNKVMKILIGSLFLVQNFQTVKELHFGSS